MSQMYPSGLQGFAAGALDWDAHNFKMAFLPAAYSYNGAHDNLDDVTGIATPVATSANLASKTNVAGTCSAADFTLSSVSGSPITCAVLYRDTGTPSTSTLVAFYDGFTLTPNGDDVTFRVNASGLFTL